jgi:hypothetical protein
LGALLVRHEYLDDCGEFPILGVSGFTFIKNRGLLSLVLFTINKGGDMSLVQVWQFNSNEKIAELQKKFHQKVQVKPTGNNLTFVYMKDEHDADELARWMKRNAPQVCYQLKAEDRL